jgi:hypothetical protein
MATSERKAQHAAAPPAVASPATGTAYAVVRRLPEVWGMLARGPEAVLVTDGHTLEVLGRSGLAASYAREARHRFRPTGDPVATLQQLSSSSTYFRVDGPTAAAEPLDRLVDELAGRYGLEPLSTSR